MTQIENLKQFYALMNETRKARIEIVDLYLDSSEIPDTLLTILQEALHSLEHIPQIDERYSIALDDEKKIALDLQYEISELKKDIFFITHTEDEFLDYLASLHPRFQEEVSAGVEKLKDIFFKNFITDRDGTVNNYCGRYASSIQSAYNAVFLSRFAMLNTETSIILTSAPLDDVGLANTVVSPENVFLLAGSKGREYFDRNGERRQYPVAEDKQAVLDRLNRRISELLQQTEYEKFALIGSGLQHKFGQTTIARQDISGSIPEDESMAFMAHVKNIVAEVDPEHNYFQIEDTGYDIEIILTVEPSDATGKAKDFDKGNGIEFLNTDLNLSLEKGPILICGDTKSDVPMVAAAVKKTKKTWSVFVTEDDSLRRHVRSLCPLAHFVSTPDILVTILSKVAQ